MDKGEELLELIKQQTQEHETALSETTELMSKLKDEEASVCKSERKPYREEIKKLNNHINFLLLELQNS